MLTALRVPPGCYRSGTAYQSKGRWYDANLIRFTDGRIEPVGGWVQAQGVTLDGPGRGMHAWRADSGGSYAGIGTVDKLWAYDGDGAYDITPASFPPGNLVQAIIGGYGGGDYGDGDYGASGAGGKAESTSWTVDNFGQYMVACASHDGKVYVWQLVSATPAALISGAPEGRAIFVTPERFLVVLGANLRADGTTPGNARTMAWCDQTDYTTWISTSTNQAGDIDLQTEGTPIRGLRCRGQSLILTTTDAHTMRYLGQPYIYGFERVGDACGLVGTNAAVAFNGGAAWMSYESFQLFDGVSVKPIDCELSDLIFGDLNADELAQVWAEHRAAFGEIIWHYPSAGSTYCDRYATWNYLENHWTPGSLVRTAGLDSGVFEHPLATHHDGTLYEHENGWTDDGASRLGQVYLESGPVEIADGERVLSVTQVVPDEVTPGAFQLRLATQFTPEGTEYSHGPYALLPYTDVRVTGRQLALRIEGVSDEDARIGLFRLEVKSGGRR